VCPSLEYHVSTLLQPLIYELVAGLGRLAWLPASCEEDSAFFVLDRHKVGRYLDVDNVGSVRVGAEVVHEEVVRVVHEEVKSVDHLPIVAH